MLCTGMCVRRAVASENEHENEHAGASAGGREHENEHACRLALAPRTRTRKALFFAKKSVVRERVREQDDENPAAGDIWAFTSQLFPLRAFRFEWPSVYLQIASVVSKQVKVINFNLLGHYSFCAKKMPPPKPRQ